MDNSKNIYIVFKHYFSGSNMDSSENFIAAYDTLGALKRDHPDAVPFDPWKDGKMYRSTPLLN